MAFMVQSESVSKNYKKKEEKNNRCSFYAVVKRVFPLSTVSWQSERVSMVSRDGDSSVSRGISVEGPEFDSFLII